MAQYSLTAAVMAAGPAPDGDGYVGWLHRVAIITDDLEKVAEAREAREQRKQAVHDAPDGAGSVFNALLVDAHVVTKGSGDDTVQKGELVLRGRAPNPRRPDGNELIETDLLNTAAGAEEFARAQTMIGRQVVIYKLIKSIGDNKKARECVAIELADGAMFAESASAPRQPDVAPAAPPVTQAPAATQEPVAHQSTPAPASDPVPSDPVERAAAAQAVVNQQPAAAVPQPETQPSAAAPTGDLSGVTVESLADLRSAAQQHLGMTLDDINGSINTKFGLPPGEDRQLPKRLLQKFWQELADSCVPVG